MAINLRTLVVLTALVLGGCRSLLFSDHVGCEDCDPGVPVEGTKGRVTRPTPEHPWVPLVDACMSEGKTRTECIESLPPDVLAELEAWEAENAAMRRNQLERRVDSG